MSETWKRRVFIAVVMVVALFPICKAIPLAVGGYVQWLDSWYDPAEEYQEIYTEGTEIRGKSPMAADTDAALSAAAPGCLGILGIVFVLLVGGEILAVETAERTWDRFLKHS